MAGGASTSTLLATSNTAGTFGVAHSAPIPPGSAIPTAASARMRTVVVVSCVNP
ncbi:MAG TPA: hypothetical protein VF310_11010 [Vicinamibacteria bacterium]